MIARLAIRTLRCEECGAPPGKRCIARRSSGRAKQREANHATRVRAYLAAMRLPPIESYDQEPIPEADLWKRDDDEEARSG